MCFSCGNRVSQRAHLKRFRHACKARQPLRALSSWDDPELDLRLADPGGLQGDPVVAALCRLQPTTESEAVDGGHGGLGGVFEGVDHGDQPGAAPLLPGRDLAELLDVCAGNERPPGSDQHNRPDTLVGH